MADDHVVLAHGGGGALTRELVEGLIIPSIGGALDGLPDAASIPSASDFMFTTDGFVVKPLFFRGGDIGSLSVHGTVNDLAVSGARPLAISMALILEEGLHFDILRRVIESAAKAARTCGIQIITGDTKVVSRGEADQLFVTTAGIGQRCIHVSPKGVRPGDAVLINGGIAEHGIAVMSEREGIDFQTQVKSDSAPVWPFVQALLNAGVGIHAMRDPTRGGVSATCVEIANDSNVTIALDETALPISNEVRGACEMLGLDPLNVANEGKLIVYVPAEETEKALAAMKTVPGGERAALIGGVVERRAVPVLLRTRYGGERVVEMPYGEDLPRIC